MDEHSWLLYHLVMVMQSVEQVTPAGLRGHVGQCCVYGSHVSPLQRGAIAQQYLLHFVHRANVNELERERIHNVDKPQFAA